MKCPLLCIAAAVNNKRHPIEAADCLKEECAWWVPAFECCAIWEIAIRLGSCADQLFNMNEITKGGGV